MTYASNLNGITYSVLGITTGAILSENTDFIILDIEAVICLVGQSCGIGQTIALTLGGLINPTFAMINQLSFKLTISSPNGYGILSSATTTVLATPPLKLGSIDKISITQSGSLVTSALTRYDITFKLQQTLSSEFELLILLPDAALMPPPTGVVMCSDTVAKKNFTCHPGLPFSDGGYILSINVSDFCAVATCTLGASYSLTLTNVVNVDFARERTG